MSDPSCPVLADCQADLDAYFSDVDLPPDMGADPIHVPTFHPCGYVEAPDLEASALDEAPTDLTWTLPEPELA